VTIPSTSFLRRLSRVVIVVSSVLAGTAALWACGPYFPRWLLGPERLLVPAPEGLLRHEIGRLKLAEPPKAVPAVDPWQQTAEAGVEDLKRALEAEKAPAARREALIAQYAEVRKALAQFASSVTVFENVSEPLWEDEEGGEPAAPAVLPADLRAPEGLPGELADYLEGAIAYHRGDLGGAVSAWEKLLQRPDSERRFRSTWAAFMLGKAHLRAGRPVEAARWFARTRETAGQKGFEDSLGLAAASLGWEARAERDLGHFDKALVLYARQARGDDPTGPSSLQFVARQALKAGPDALAPVARSAEARAVLTAFLVADADAPWELWEIEEAEEAAGPDAPEVDPGMAAWLSALQKAGIKEVDGADRIAWAAYQGGDFAAARRWLDRAPADAPMARWIRARLLLRDGKLTEAQALLEQTAATLPDPKLTEDEMYMHGPDSAGGKLAMPALARGESAVFLTTQGSYLEALDRFLRSSFWVDAAHLADRVLTVDELKIYVDATWPADLIRDLPEDAYPLFQEGLAAPNPAQLAHDIRYLLGRRLVRAGRYEEAKAYLPADWTPSLDTLTASLRQGEDTRQPADQRATALFRAACLARKQGMELMGTELAPDWFLFEGQYEVMNYREQLYGRAQNPHLKPGPDELQKYEQNRPDPDARFHYRYKAADLARKAAALLPDGSDQKARILATAGSWLKARDPEAARPFYKALLDCCGDTTLGQEAQRVRWFPEVPDCEEE
jgi:tetratricopeptide (TPR) repeat protein